MSYFSGGMMAEGPEGGEWEGGVCYPRKCRISQWPFCDMARMSRHQESSTKPQWMATNPHWTTTRCTHPLCSGVRIVRSTFVFLLVSARGASCLNSLLGLCCWCILDLGCFYWSLRGGASRLNSLLGLCCWGILDPGGEASLLDFLLGLRSCWGILRLWCFYWCLWQRGTRVHSLVGFS